MKNERWKEYAREVFNREMFDTPAKLMFKVLKSKTFTTENKKAVANVVCASLANRPIPFYLLHNAAKNQFTAKLKYETKYTLADKPNYEDITFKSCMQFDWEEKQEQEKFFSSLWKKAMEEGKNKKFGLYNMPADLAAHIIQMLRIYTKGIFHKLKKAYNTEDAWEKNYILEVEDLSPIKYSLNGIYNMFESGEAWYNKRYLIYPLILEIIKNMGENNLTKDWEFLKGLAEHKIKEGLK